MNSVDESPIDIKLGDSQDFIGSNEPKDFKRNLLMSALFSGFPYLLVISLLLYSTSVNG